MSHVAPELLDRSRPPATGTARPFRFPPFVDLRLAGGLRLLAARLEPFPLVSLDLLFRAGGQEDPPGRAGCASLHASVIDEGTADKNALEIAATIERLGGSLSSSSDWDATYLATELLAAHLEPGLELLAEIAAGASFPDAEVERLRRQRLTEILRQKDQPSVLAHRFFLQAVYPGTVYGELPTGSEQSIGNLDRNDLLEFHTRHVAPGASTLVVVGALDPEALAARAEAIFGRWADRAVDPEPAVVPPLLEHTVVHIVDRPGAAQTQLQLGHAGVPRRHPDRHALAVLNSVFGGKFTSRINLNLRERHGFTYGAQSQLVSRRGPGPFIIQTAVATQSAGAAVGELIHELRLITREPITQEELEESRRYLTGVFPYTVQTAGDVARRLEDIATFDFPADYYDDYPAVLGRITREQVLEAGMRHLRPEQLAIVAVGPAETLRPQLERFGTVEIHQP